MRESERERERERVCVRFGMCILFERVLNMAMTFKRMEESEIYTKRNIDVITGGVRRKENI